MKNEKNNNDDNDNNNTGGKKYKYCVSLTQRRSEKISEFSLWYNSKKKKIIIIIIIIIRWKKREWTIFKVSWNSPNQPANWLTDQ